MSAAAAFGINPTNFAAVAAEAAGPSPAARGGDAYANLSSDEFLKIMLTELSNQDPFEPNDSQAILEQLSSLRSIESDLELQEQLGSLVLQNSIGQAGALIGKHVEGLSTNNDQVSGIVTAVRVVDGKAELELDTGYRLPIDRVGTVTNEPASVTDQALPATPVASLASAKPAAAAVAQLLQEAGVTATEPAAPTS